MANEVRLGRLVQCDCKHTCFPNSKHGFQWLLPRTKSKHMMYQHIQQKNQTMVTSVNHIQKQLDSFSLNKQKENRLKIKKKNFKMPILMEIELKKKITCSEKSHSGNMVLKEFYVKSSYN